MNNDLRLNLGKIFFKNIKDDYYEIIRVMDIKDDKLVCKYLNNSSEKVEYTLQEILDAGYTYLYSHAVCTVNKVTLTTDTVSGDKINDIIVVVSKRDRESLGFEQASLVCRQNISDFLIEPMLSVDMNNIYYGISITNDSLPSDYTMADLLVYDDIIYDKYVNLYMNDTLDTFMELIGSDFDDTLTSIAKYHVNELAKLDPSYGIKYSDNTPECLFGVCKDLKTLLNINNFFNDFYSLFNGIKIKEVIEFNEDTDDIQMLPEDIISSLNMIYGISIVKHFIMPFDLYIDLNSIKVPYLYIVDKNNKPYIVVYNTTDNAFIYKEDTTENTKKNINSKLLNLVDIYDKYTSLKN